MGKWRSGFGVSTRFIGWFPMIMLFNCLIAVHGASRIPAVFVFGDSLVDDGNNNYLRSIARANYFPYGIDFNQGATGRFSNGRTLADIFCEAMGLPYLPPFAIANWTTVSNLNGVNYASGASGILDETGRHLGDRFSLSQQVLNFQTTLSSLRFVMDPANLAQYLAKSIVILTFGTHDYVSNYLLPNLYGTSYNYTPPAFASLLLNTYARQILTLRNLGFRKFVLVGVGPIGCTPIQLVTGQAQPGRCVDYVNQIVGSFNVGLRSLVEQLNTNLPDSTFVYANIYGILGDILNNPPTYRLAVINRPCCSVMTSQGQFTCIPSSAPCPNREAFLYWDALNPTQAVNMVLAQRIYMGPSNDCYPMNLQQLSLI